MSNRAAVLEGTHSSPKGLWLIALAICVFIAISFHDGLVKMVETWLGSEEYSHGLLLPLLSAYLIWQRRAELNQQEWPAQWSGMILVTAGLSINIVARLAAVYTLQQYALVLTLYGLVVCYGGWRLLRTLAAPLLLLLFMVPLPNFFMNNLSAELQLLSSKIGVLFIRMAGISVFLEGNVIDLGTYKLQVAEACSGLRYLFPLMTMGFIMAYLFRASWWKRWLVFLSSIPLTILMNSLRIGVIGVMVEHWGIAMAEGFLHEFQGWAVFMLTACIMLLEIILLARLGRDGGSWRDSFGSLQAAPPVVSSGDTTRSGGSRAVPQSMVAALLLLVVTAPVAWAFSAREELVPQRSAFAEFPQRLDVWQGHRSAIDQVYLDVLMLDDYIMADYVDTRATGNTPPVNFYVAWYGSQRAGQSVHSPRSCLPGGGWTISALEQMNLGDVKVGSQALHVNRAIIENGANKQLVYYWFQQRGRVITSEYMVKWYLFWDSLTRQRSDGALVRLMVAVPEGQSIDQVEEEVKAFARSLAPKLEAYVPG